MKAMKAMKCDHCARPALRGIILCKRCGKMFVEAAQ